MLTLEKVYVNVDYQVLVGGAIKPVRIYWHDGRAFDIRKTLHCCTSEDEYEGIRYTVLIGSAEKYLYRIGGKWYVEPIQTEVDTTREATSHSESLKNSAKQS